MSDFMLQYGDELLPVEGDFPQVGAYLPSFMLVGDGKQDVALESLGGVPKLILTLLSLDEYEHGGQYLLQETRRFLERWPQIGLVVITVDSPSSLARARREHGLPMSPCCPRCAARFPQALRGADPRVSAQRLYRAFLAAGRWRQRHSLRRAAA